MSVIFMWFLFALLVIFGLALLGALLFFIAAAFWGLARGVKQLREGNVQVQDKTLPPPT